MDENLEETLQDAHPEGVLLLAELLGNISSYHMPFQCAESDWQLVAIDRSDYFGV